MNGTSLRPEQEKLNALKEVLPEAFKAGYKKIADISKERIRRAEKKIATEDLTEIQSLKAEIKKLQAEPGTDKTEAKIKSLTSKLETLENQDLGFKVIKLSESNFKQWRQIDGKDTKVLEEQMRDAEIEIEFKTI